MKKVLFHINSMGKGGAERVMSNLMDMFVEEGIEIVLATEWQAEDEYRINDKVRRIHVGLLSEEENDSRVKKLIIRWKRLRKCIQKERPDIVVAFSKNANYRAVLATLGMPIPVVVSERSNPSFQYKGLIARLKGEIIYRLADGNVFQTEYAKEFFSRGLQKNSTVIMNPLNEKYLYCEQAKVRSKDIVSVGRLVQSKNQKMMIEAMKKIHTEYPEHVLKIYGSGSEDGVELELRNLIDTYSLQNNVKLMGNSDSLEKDIIDASLFLLTSDYEGMPNSLLEAMAMGIPCIATDCPCGGSRYLIEKNNAGILIPMGQSDILAEKIRYGLEHTDEMQQMGKRARYVKEELHPEKIYKQWLQYLERIIQGEK